MTRFCAASLGLFVMALTASVAAEDLGKDMIECQITLPNGMVYYRGATDPVAKLEVKVKLTNKTAAEKKGLEEIKFDDAEWLTEEEILKVRNMTTQEERQAFIKSKTTSKTRELPHINKDSLGYPYVPPQLGPHETVELVVMKQPPAEAAEGEGAGEGEAKNAKPVKIRREMPVLYTDPQDLVPTAYLAAGETSPEYTLEVGKYLDIQEPGIYTIKIIMPGIPSSQSPSENLESNVEQFQVLPYKTIDLKLADVQKDIEHYERGHPNFDYMFYQLPTSGEFKEIYYVQRFFARGGERWEWHRLCSLAPKKAAQVKQVNPKKVAILAPHYKGDIGLYTVDFSGVDPLITSKTLTAEGDNIPTLRVEDGQVTAE